MSCFFLKHKRQSALLEVQPCSSTPQRRKLCQRNETAESDTYIGLEGTQRSRMTRDRVTCQVTVSTPVYPVYRCMLLGQVSRRRRNGCSGLTEIAGVGLDNDGIVDSEFKQQKHCNLRSTTTTLCQPFTTTAFAKRAFRCSAPAVWNSLPKTVLSSDFVAVFKSIG